MRDLRPAGRRGRGRPGGDRPRGRLALSPAARCGGCARSAAGPGPLGARTAALIEVLYGCGLRASEAAGLDLSACHLDDPDDPFLLVRGKGDKRRAVAVPREAPRRADRLPARRPPRAARPRPQPRGPTRRSHRDADAVFLSARGRRLGRAAVWRIVTDVADRAGLRDDGERVFPHALRHSCGTHLIQSGVDIRYVQAHLGHASPVTTRDLHPRHRRPPARGLRPRPPPRPLRLTRGLPAAPRPLPAPIPPVRPGGRRYI